MSNRKTRLRDEVEFTNLVKSSRDTCKLRSVSFVKPIWGNTSHSRGGNDLVGDQHLADLVEAVESSSCAASTMIIVTYDENGASLTMSPRQARTSQVYLTSGVPVRVCLLSSFHPF